MARDLRQWELRYDSWSPDEHAHREALTTLGNGFFATRGAAEEASEGGAHYPGTYLAGGYNRLESEVAGRTVEHEDLVNWPNWLPLSFRCPDGPWLDLDNLELLDYELRLDLLRGVLLRRIDFRDEAGREFSLTSQRLVHMGRPHVAGLCWDLTPLNWSGIIEVRTALDGRVVNAGVARYQNLEKSHIEVVDRGRLDQPPPRHYGPASPSDVLFLVARARRSGLVVALAARTHVEGTLTDTVTDLEANYVAQRLFVHCRAREPLRVEKIVALYSSRDFAISEPKTAACSWALRVPRFDDLVASQTAAWRFLWRHMDLELTSQDSAAQPVLRLHLFHLLQTASLHTIDRDVGLPARGLHGEAYRGHIFWDELFAFPLFNLRLPELTRSFLMYRYRRLEEARHAARSEGYRGAMFPWQSGSDGREETPTLHLNPRSGRWVTDNTQRQRHVGSAIAYNVWQYYQATGDSEFLSTHGAELLIEIARFWASIAKQNERSGRYEIHGVVGPDEFHTTSVSESGEERGGLSNNAYTNVTACWALSTALEALTYLSEERRRELLDILKVAPEELELWDRVSRLLYVPFQNGGIISQFDGWDELSELDWEAYRQRYGDIHRLDRLLEAEGDDINRYQAAKQADVLMLFFLFSRHELRNIFERLGYEWTDDLVRKNTEYYLERTSDGSTLSKVVHAWVLASTDRKHSFYLFRQALASDVEDVQGGTTAEGIHIGAMAGTVDLIQRCYTGLTIRRDALWLDPQLPDELDRLRLSVRYKESWLKVDITHESTTVHVEHGKVAPVCVGFRRTFHALAPGEVRTFRH